MDCQEFFTMATDLLKYSVGKTNSHLYQHFISVDNYDIVFSHNSSKTTIRVFYSEDRENNKPSLLEFTNICDTSPKLFVILLEVWSFVKPKEKN